MEQNYDSMNNWQRAKEMQGHKYYQKWEAAVKTSTKDAGDGTQKTVIASVTKKGSKPLETVLLDPKLIDSLNLVQAGAGYHYFESEGPTEEDVFHGHLNPKVLTENK